ncbi:MAG: CvpA family protein [Balneolaceae bacterium]|nr:CvpA family protein [Balneolaceae bacterium]
MTLLDIILLAPILYAAYNGFLNGIIKEVISIVGIILAVILTFTYMDTVGFWIAPIFEEGSSAVPFVAGGVIFISTLIAVNITAYMMKEFLEALNINIVNRLAGILFGFLKSSIVISAILLILAGLGIPTQDTRERSATYPILIQVAPATYNAIVYIFPGASNFDTQIESALDDYAPIPDYPMFNQ